MRAFTSSYGHELSLPKMIASLFLTIGVLFAVLVFKAFSSREILARGWGSSTRTYCRDEEPIKYWVTLISYLVIAAWTSTFGLIAAFGRVF